MIDQAVVDTAHGTALAFIGSHDKALRPHGAPVVGLRVDVATSRITAFIPIEMGHAVIADLREVRRATVVFGSPESHKAFQIKGAVVEIRTCTSADEAIQDVFVAKLYSAFKAGGLPMDDWAERPYKPAMAVVIAAEDIFDQAPGPKAGSRVGP